jgi:hypothetical protein
VKTYPLDPKEVDELAALAAHNPFFASIYLSFQKYGSLTEKQLVALRNESDPQLRVDGVLVVNRLVRDNRVVCFRCRSFATHAVGKVGVCGDHIADQQRANAEYLVTQAPVKTT